VVPPRLHPERKIGAATRDCTPGRSGGRSGGARVGLEARYASGTLSWWEWGAEYRLDRAKILSSRFGGRRGESCLPACFQNSLRSNLHDAILLVTLRI
jgi:hypothetical protein